MNKKTVVTVAFLIALAFILSSLSYVITYHTGVVEVSTTRVLTAFGFNNPYCLGAMSFTGGTLYRTLYAFSLYEGGYYVVNQSFTTVKLYVPGNVSFYLSGGTLYKAVLYVRNSTNFYALYPGKSLFLSPGYYNLSEALYFMSPSFPQTLTGELNVSIKGAVYYVYDVVETVEPVSGGVINFLNGNNVFGYVLYQGYSTGKPSTAIPYLTTLGSGQEVLVLVKNQKFAAGIAMTNSSYYNGTSISEEIVGLFTQGSYPYADGYSIGMFLTPSSGTYEGNSLMYENFSIPYYISNPGYPAGQNFPQLGNTSAYSPVQGALILPYSTTSYLLVQWDPYWQTGYKGGQGGQFNVFIVKYTSPSSPPKVINYTGVGTGVFQPNPYDLICFRVTFYLNGTLIAKVVDLNTGQTDYLFLTIRGFYPKHGHYWSYLMGDTDGSNADWSVIYWNFSTY